MILIDGAQGEGGGQILRIALLLSSITKRPFKIINIRKNRKKPGLKPQHLGVIKVLKEITRGGIVEGDKLNSTTLLFSPGEIAGGNIIYDFKTAGSIPLFFQTIFPVTLFAKNPTHLEVIGGTDVPGGPTIDYFEKVFLPLFQPAENDQTIRLKVERRGYYPRGGGRVILSIKSSENFHIPDFYFDPESELQAIKGIVVVSNSLKRREVGKRLKESAYKILKENFPPLSVSIILKKDDTLSPGCSITLWGKFNGRRAIGACGLGKIGVPAEQIGKGVANRFIREIKNRNSLDIHLSDHLVPLMAMQGGKGDIQELSTHFKTALEISQKFINFKFNYKREKNRISYRFEK